MKPEERFEQAVAAVREESIDPRTVEAASERAWTRIAHEAGALVEMAGSAASGSSVTGSSATGSSATGNAAAVDVPHVDPLGLVDHIIGCEGFRGLIPAYLAGTLADSKRVLLEDHTRECLPCRRALAATRKGSAKSVVSAAPAGETRSGAASVRRWAAAAALAGMTLLTGAFVWQGGAGYLGARPSATVRSIDGELAVVVGGAIRPAIAGERIEGRQVVRTAQGSGAVLELADGSRVELAERSELGLGRRWDGTVLELERGSLIVEAAKQRHGHLYVDTGDCRVSVVGTIFSVNRGAKGSRVSVIEGEVHVQEGAELAVLLPGQQHATGHRLTAVSVADEISWSRDAARYRERLAALQNLGHEIDLALVPDAARTSTRLLDLVPEGTGVYVGLPNISHSLGQAWQIVQTRVAENPVLGEWWSEHFSNPADEAEIAQAITELERFGGELGDEIVVAIDLAAPAAGTPHSDGEPLLLAEVRHPEQFSALLDEEIARLNQLSANPQPGGTAPTARVRRISDPTSASATTNELLVWTTGDLLLASPSAARLAAVQGELATQHNAFVGTQFHSRLAEAYSGGTEWLIGVDFASLVAQGSGTGIPADAGGDDSGEAIERLGLADADYLILDSRSAGGETQNRAHLGFKNERRGIASWLAEPAPVGALEFVSPAAHFAVGGVLKEPSAMLDDLLALMDSHGEGESGALRGLAAFESAHGLSLRDDFAATLGGDFAFAFDGPWLPMPSWKLVLEVNDSARLQASLVTLVDEWNREAAGSAGEGRPVLHLSQEAIAGQVVYDLSTSTGNDLAHFLFVDGFLLVGPSRALLLESVTQRGAGISLVASSSFLDLLPQDGEANYSAVVYQNLGGELGALGELLGSRSGMRAPERERLTALAAQTGPSLAVAYGEAAGLTLATRGVTGPMGLSFESLFAVSGLLGGHPATADAADAADAAGAAQDGGSAATGDETSNGPQA
ncbi:MAG: FecR domain-containing protein [Thermoanaerobaculia bacterium]